MIVCSLVQIACAVIMILGMAHGIEISLGKMDRLIGWLVCFAAIAMILFIEVVLK